MQGQFFLPLISFYKESSFTHAPTRKQNAGPIMKNLRVFMAICDTHKKGFHSFFASFSIKKGFRSFLRKSSLFRLPTRHGMKIPHSVLHRSGSRLHFPLPYAICAVRRLRVHGGVPKPFFSPPGISECLPFHSVTPLPGTLLSQAHGKAFRTRGFVDLCNTSAHSALSAEYILHPAIHGSSGMPYTCC